MQIQHSYLYTLFLPKDIVKNIPNSERAPPSLVLMTCTINRTTSNVPNPNPSRTAPAGVRKGVH
jgi:hypothetical protein